MSKMDLTEGDEDDEDSSSFNSPKGKTSSSSMWTSVSGASSSSMKTPTKSPVNSYSFNINDEDDNDDETNNFGLSDHQIEKKRLFRNSEKDRMKLIAENKKLRDVINSTESRILGGSQSLGQSLGQSVQEKSGGTDFIPENEDPSEIGINKLSIST